MRVLVSVLRRGLLGFLILGLSCGAYVLAAAPPEPTYGTATVNGDPGEWNLANDFFADMYRAGDPTKKVESKFYLRYDCSTQTMYALVLTVDDTPPDDIPVLVEPDNAWIAINGVANKVVDGGSGNDGTPPDFAWIGQSYNGNNNHAKGWEVSFSLAPGTYKILAHTNVFDDGASQTSAVDRKTDQAGIALVVICGGPPPPPGAAITALKADSLFDDKNNNGKVNPGDIVLYTVTVTNTGSAAATNVTYSDTVDANTNLLCSSPDAPTTSQGTVTSCTVGGNLIVDIGDINAGASVTITYKVQVKSGNFTKISNQGKATGDNIPDQKTDDPDTGNSDDPTETVIEQPPVGGDPPIYGSIMVFPTPELAWGGGPYRDFNDNHSSTDCILRYMDLKTGRVLSAGVAVSCEPRQIDIYEKIIVFVGEGNQIRYYDIRTGIVSETGVSGSYPTIYENIIAFASEGTIHYFDLSTRVLINTGIPGEMPVLYDGIIAFVAGTPATVRYYDLRTGLATDTGAVGTQPFLHGKIIAFTSGEREAGLDLSGNGDLKDRVIRYYDVESASLHNTGAVGAFPAIFGKIIVFHTGERAVKQDLNGDGDKQDVVIRYYDLGLNRVFNTGRVGVEPDIYEDVITYWVFESWDRFDINGDGDRSDPIVQTYRIPTRDASVDSPELQVSLTVTSVRAMAGRYDVRFVAEGLGIEEIKVQVLDLMGIEVYRSEFTPGQEVRWQMENRAGARIANGIYLYVVTVKGGDGIRRSAIKKLVVLR
ncbi:DUF11 domain-containing protein [Candidatus Acetothermia bacterium]|nr:DUF11 domain-containing protein [Candidatus Acetothermia bacterium]MCI2432468.1 DUF11 domain-containing protein [Candidatus Acetothermia bacterium]MCI2437106.1 DUF11 domain-containing protein [Candidatus Acetothermia bacterium]